MLSQSAGYATTALGCIAAMGGKPVLVKVVAEACGIPQPYLAKIVNLLARAGLLQTQRGVGGGVCLARPPQEIKLVEICAALDDHVLQPKCMLGNATCGSDRACPAHAFCNSYRGQLADFLEGTTVADIAAFETRRRWGVASGRKTDTSLPSATGQV